MCDAAASRKRPGIDVKLTLLTVTVLMVNMLTVNIHIINIHIINIHINKHVKYHT